MSESRSGGVSGRVVATSLSWAVVLGLLIAIPTGNNRVFSVQVWFAVASLFLALLLGAQVVKRLPVEPPPLLALWSRSAAAADDDEHVPRSLRATEHLLLRSRDNERAHVAQLRPRLRALAMHNLQIEHGVDMTADPDRANPDRANKVLGDVAWLVDPQVTTRRPTMQEVDDFLIRIQGDHR